MEFGNLAAAVLLAFVIERVFAVIYDLQWVNDKIKANDGNSFKGLIAAGASVALCWAMDINVLRDVGSLTETDAADVPSFFAYLISGLLVAGGSQGAVKLFQDVLGFSKANRDILKLAEKEEAQARIKTAQKKAVEASLDAEQLGIELDLKRKKRLGSLITGTEAGSVPGVKPEHMVSTTDPYLRDVIDNWEEFVLLRAELKAQTG